MIEKLGITPGPWLEDCYIGEDEYDDPDSPFVVIGFAKWGPNKVDIPAAIGSKRVASVIAAAPEMLEVLIKIVREWKRGSYSPDWFLDNIGAVKAIEEATGLAWERLEQALIEEE